MTKEKKTHDNEKAFRVMTVALFEIVQIILHFIRFLKRKIIPVCF